MKKKYLLFTLIAGLGSLAISSYHSGAANNGYDCTGAEAAGTGTLANPTGCSQVGGCHGTSATTTVIVAIELDSAGVATTHYRGGHTYTVKITGTNGTGTSLTQYGFQLAALKGTASAATVTNAGTWSTTGLPASTHLTAPGMYTQLTVAEQSSAISVSGTTFTQSFSWTAPVIGTGAISFWGAANFVNGNTSADAGDKYNTNKVVINEWASDAGVAGVANNLHLAAYPNPVNNRLQLQINDANAGNYSLNIFDLNGKCISNQNLEITSNSFEATINTTSWAAGLYNVVIGKDGSNTVIPVAKQ